MSRQFNLNFVRFPALLCLLLGLCLGGCSAWNVEPKTLDGSEPTVDVYTYDIVATPATVGTVWKVTFAIVGSVSSDPNKAITSVGVCYYLAADNPKNQPPTTLSNTGLVTARTNALPNTAILTATQKKTYSYRAFISLKDGTERYGRLLTFTPQ